MKLYVVGIGPGELSQITPAAMAAMEQSDIIAGYTVYVDLVRERFPGKTFLTTAMKREVDRCRMAIEQTVAGKTVSMVCSGDAGVYGMAGLIYELAQQYPPIEIEVIPGITAAMSGAAVLGAPLIHDFAVISLSDLLTPLEKIMTRVELAAQADFVLCFYNPASKKRADYLKHACELILKHRSPDTPCGLCAQHRPGGAGGPCDDLAGAAGRAGGYVHPPSLVGNSQTRRIGDKLVTPAGI